MGFSWWGGVRWGGGLFAAEAGEEAFFSGSLPRAVWGGCVFVNAHVFAEVLCDRACEVRGPLEEDGGRGGVVLDDESAPFGVVGAQDGAMGSPVPLWVVDTLSGEEGFDVVWGYSYRATGGLCPPSFIPSPFAADLF